VVLNSILGRFQSGTLNASGSGTCNASYTGVQCDRPSANLESESNRSKPFDSGLVTKLMDPTSHLYQRRSAEPERINSWNSSYGYR
jgi:hypothetical protein